jgi:hypothetical protein
MLNNLLISDGHLTSCGFILKQEFELSLYKIVSTLEGFGYTLMTFTSSP